MHLLFVLLVNATNVLHCVAVHCVQAVGCAGKRHSSACAYVCVGGTPWATTSEVMVVVAVNVSQ